ncbi:MAG: menaquinol oxidoreductase [Desulfuromonadales bacterium GWD2_61_12]|nr:MAG: menaquinol oxidoreductase [Desulfuromonadales bacterium GWC2_61_20]OGR36880.1 MAG: menaquinol oxidoreductase [Desulfuromonadales bacterium GWD2_61_12]
MKKKWLIVGTVVAAGVVGAGLGLFYSLPLDLRDRSPRQPLAFSHKLHAGANGIHCLFCHRAAPLSPLAGLPTLADCLDCHRFIAPEAPEIKKLQAFWDRREAIPWVRVYSLPDHVYFSHQMHLHAGVACNACHDDVAGMERVTRSASLKMGWCLDCHRRQRATIDCWTCHI